MKKIAAIIVSCMALVAMFICHPVIAGTNTNGDEICNSDDAFKNNQYICGYGDEGDATKMVTNILEAVFGIIAIIATIVIIIAGIMYMTSRGSEEQVKKAKNAILYAVIGLIVSLAAYAIVKFVLKQL